LVIEELGFGSHEERLDKYFKDKVYSVTNKIHRAEDLISRKTGRIFTVNSRDWEIYNDTVIKQAALFILAIMRNYENNNVSVAGKVRYDLIRHNGDDSFHPSPSASKMR